MGLYQILTDPGDFQFYPSQNGVSTTATFGQKDLTFGNTNQPYVVIPPPEKAKFLTPIEYEAGAFQFDSVQGFSFEKGNLFPYLGSVFASLPSQIRYNPKSWGPDFLWRGNLYGIVRAFDDVKRLSKYFGDVKSFSGPLFVIKQNLLSIVGVKTESSRGTAYGSGYINEGIYTPASTIAQAPVGFLGIFLNKQGIDPTGLIPQLKINSYQDSIYTRQLRDNAVLENRLVALTEKSSVYGSNFVGTIPNSSLFSQYGLIPNNDTLIRYSGGPGAPFGIGGTNIKYATDNTGKRPLKVLTTKKDLLSLYPQNFQAYAPIPITLDRAQLDHPYSNPLLSETDTKEDFRKILLSSGSIGQTIFLSSSPSYKVDAVDSDGKSISGNIEKRINYRNPSARGDRSNYIKGKVDLFTKTPLGPTDLINAFPIYNDSNVTDNPLTKDLIDFRIGIFDNSSIGGGNATKYNWLHFRVFLDDFNDSYNGEWKGIEYMGRGEKFYKYNGFKRDISLKFTIAVASKEELAPVYKKLNYLASSLAPYYSTNGYMSGNLSRITLGGWLFEQPGFISSMDIDIPDESPWETNVPIEGNRQDRYTKQLPHMVQVTLKFTPIHVTRPEIMKLSDFPNPENITSDNILYKDSSPEFGTTGRFIALSNGASLYDVNVPNPVLTSAQDVPTTNEIPLSSELPQDLSTKFYSNNPINP